MKKTFLICLTVIVMLLMSTASAEEWTCQNCGRVNSGNFCPDCGMKSTAWKCPVCGQVNGSSFCENCGLARPSDEELGVLKERAKLKRDYPILFGFIVVEYAEIFNLQPSLVMAIIRNESFFDAQAESADGSLGLMQLKPDLARWIAEKHGFVDLPVEEFYSPERNIQFGCWYLAYLGETMNPHPVCLVAAYHAGPEQVALWLADPAICEDGETISVEKLPEGATKSYVRRVMRDQKVYQELYGLD